MIRGLGHRRSGMLKSYFVEHILLIFLQCFLKNGYVVKNNYFKFTLLSTSVCFISQINIMHEYTETESNTQVKLEHIACGNKCT